MTETTAQHAPAGTPTPTQRQGTITFLVLGAGGDLTSRLLLPGLASLLAVETDRDVRVIGADMAELTDDTFREKIRTSFATVGCAADITEKIVGNARYFKADLTDKAALEQIVAASTDDLVIYFALPPAVTMKVCAVLESVDLPRDTRLGLEKPFGTSEASARELNDQLQRVVPEHQIYRVDHFLGTSTVLNLIGLRFANRILQPVWNSEHLERVELLYDEDLALEGRAGYYDKNGALRDMLQSHLLQILAIFAMEPIATLEPQELQDLKSQVLRAVRLWDEENPAASARRARYTAGRIGDREIPSYVDEEGVDPSREIETLAQMTVEICNSRWAGIPFVLRSGKGLGKMRKQIVCTFRHVPWLPEGFHGGVSTPDRLVIDLKPGAVSLELSMNAEGDPFDLEQKTLRAELAAAEMTAYGEVLRHVLDANPLISVRADQTELCWRIVQPVLDAYAAGRVPLEEYAAGSEGPDGWLDPVYIQSRPQR